MKKDPAIRNAVTGVAGTALVFAVLGLLGFGPWAAFGIAVGGCLATLNLILFQRIVAAFLDQKGNTAPWAVIGVLKLLGLFVVAYVVLRTGLFSALTFAIGYAALPVGITVSTLMKRPEDPETPDPVGPAEPLNPAHPADPTAAPSSEVPPPDGDVVNGPRTE